MKKSKLLTATGAFCALAPMQQSCTPESQRTESPNIIFIFMDDMGYADTSCYGETRWTTTNIDYLAENGVQFTDCYSAASVSTPSRAGLLTGRYPVRMGIQGVFFPESYTGMPLEEVTIAEILKEEGYATSCIGKWHLGHRDRFLPMNQGFDEYFGISYSNDMNGQVYMRGYEVEEYRIDQRQTIQKYTAEAVDFIKRNSDGPFFLYLAHNMVHVPIFVSEEFEGKSGAGLFGDAVLEADWSVGQIMQTLREEGIEENTLVVFASDNGPWLQEGPMGGSAGILREGKSTNYEGGVRVPCIAYWKGTIAPQKNSDVVSMLDWMPTVATLTGAELPDVRLDGYDISPILLGTGKRASEDYAYFRNGTPNVTEYRSGDWKIALPAGRTNGNFWRASTPAHDYLLFNLSEDPSEKYNLWNKYPDKAAEMLAKLEKYKAEFGEVPPALVMWGNTDTNYLNRQRQQAIEEAEAAGITSRQGEMQEFIDVE